MNQGGMEGKWKEEQAKCRVGGREERIMEGERTGREWKSWRD